MEACDDGNQNNNDGCTNCQIDRGWECINFANRPSFCQEEAVPAPQSVGGTGGQVPSPPQSSSSASNEPFVCKFTYYTIRNINLSAQLRNSLMNT